MAVKGRTTRSSLVLALTLGAACCFYSAHRAEEAFAGSSIFAVGRNSKVGMYGGVDLALKNRIASVKKTGKLTDAMRMVAAAKVRKAQDGVSKSRPFSNELQGMIKGLVQKLKGTGLEAELPMLKVPEKVKNVALLIITSNKGLCGGYNTFVLKKTKARIQELNEQDIVPKLLVVGRKGNGAAKKDGSGRLQTSNCTYTGEFYQMPDTITAKQSTEIGEDIANLFLSGEVDKVEVIYSKFVNLLNTAPVIKTLLPLSPTGIEDPEDETFKLTTIDGKLTAEKTKEPAAKAKKIEADVIFDQEPTTILNSMLPLYLNSQILSILFDSSASELASRMIAMKKATDNAKELVKKLLLIFNKKRQSYITQEICEIVGGCMASEDDGSSKNRALTEIENSLTVLPEFMKEFADSKSIPDEPTQPSDAEIAASSIRMYAMDHSDVEVNEFIKERGLQSIKWQ